jgi:hypothetical protein
MDPGGMCEVWKPELAAKIDSSTTLPTIPLRSVFPANSEF